MDRKAAYLYPVEYYSDLKMDKFETFVGNRTWKVKWNTSDTQAKVLCSYS